MDAVTFTKQSTRGPTEIVEGYYEGDIDTAHDDFKEELEGAGFEILFDEVEQFDSEVAWRAEGARVRSPCARTAGRTTRSTSRSRTDRLVEGPLIR